MEKTLQEDSLKIPVGVLIPALYNDLASEAAIHIIEVLKKIDFVKRVYICLDKASSTNS